MTASSSVFASLSASPKARLLRRMDLGFGRVAAVWSNAEDRVDYERPEGHALSLYLHGGSGTRRLDGRAASGRPGAVCVFPEGRSSRWEITERFEFIHLYLPDAELRRAFAEGFDRDARLMSVPEVTFGETPGLPEALTRLLAAVAAQDPLGAEAATLQAMLSVAAGGAVPRAVKGGLAPCLQRRLRDHVEAHLDGSIRLRDLAAVAGLSEFHFQRAFAESLGVSPHAFVARRRVERAKAMLGTAEPIAAVAAACGFSSQSHLTRAFKAGTGLTPAAYRRRLG